MKRLIVIFALVCLAFTAPTRDKDEEDELDDFDSSFFDSLQRTRMDVTETDIIKPNKGVFGMAGAALRRESSLWKNGEIPYKISHDFDQDEKKKIQAAMKEMQDKTCIRFKHKKAWHKDFVAIAKPVYSVCNFWIGKIGGMQVLNLGDGCLSRSTILHELMHALGFIHEHNRPDRDNFVAIKYGNVIDSEKHNFNKRGEHEVTLLDTDYAYDSIMHYDQYAFASGKTLGGGEWLSEIDAIRINRHYCEGKTTTTVTNPPPSPPPPIVIATATPGFGWKAQSDGITWAMNCDFYGNDAKSINVEGKDCGWKCRDDYECDHFTWNGYNGGTCWMKKGYRGSNVRASRSEGAVCGFIPRKV